VVSVIDMSNRFKCTSVTYTGSVCHLPSDAFKMQLSNQCARLVPVTGSWTNHLISELQSEPSTKHHELVYLAFSLSLSFIYILSVTASVLGYRSGGPGSIPGTTRKKVVGLERGPLSLVSITEELLGRKVAATV
jgi:hypothetical protein